MEMPYSIRQVLAMLLICVGLVSVCSAGTTTRTREVKRLKDLTLLDKSVETQDKLQSFIFKRDGKFYTPCFIG